MKARVRTLLTALALAAAVAPLPVLAAPGGETVGYDLSTRQYDVMSAGEIDGRMRLRISPDGIVGGTFMDSQGYVLQVIGGLDGTKIWLQIGNSAFPRTYTGTLIDGKLAAATAHGIHTWHLDGTPTKA